MPPFSLLVNVIDLLALTDIEFDSGMYVDHLVDHLPEQLFVLFDFLHLQLLLTRAHVVLLAKPLE